MFLGSKKTFEQQVFVLVANFVSLHWQAKLNLFKLDSSVIFVKLSVEKTWQGLVCNPLEIPKWFFIQKLPRFFF